MLNLVCFAIRGSCRKFCDNSIFGISQLFPKGVANVLTDCFNIASKKLSKVRPA